MSATFFTLGNHHDFAVVAVGDDAEDPPAKSAGLLHVAFKIGDSNQGVSFVDFQLSINESDPLIA